MCVLRECFIKSLSVDHQPYRQTTQQISRKIEQQKNNRRHQHPRRYRLPITACSSALKNIAFSAISCPIDAETHKKIRLFFLLCRRRWRRHIIILPAVIRRLIILRFEEFSFPSPQSPSLLPYQINNDHKNNQQDKDKNAG